MRFLLQLPGVRSLHKRQLLFPTVVLVGVAVVLTLGALERSEPAAVASEPVERPTPVPRPITRADLEKTPLAYHSDYWHQLAESAQPSFVLIGEAGVPGLLVGPGLAVTTVDAAREALLARTRRQLTAAGEAVDVTETEGSLNGDGGAAVAESDGRAEAEAEAEAEAVPVQGAAPAGGVEEDAGPHRLRSWDDQIGLALFDVDRTGDSAFTLSDARSLPSGSFIGAITLDDVGHPAITPGYLVATRSLAEAGGGSDLIMSMGLPEAATIAAVVDLDGRLIGLAFESAQGLRVVTTTTLLGLIDQLQMESACRSVEVADLDATVKELLNLDRGVLVEHLRTDVFEPQLSLAGGDILVTWGGEEVSSKAQFEELYDAQPSGSLVSYRALRSGRRVTGAVVMPGEECTPLQSDLTPLARFGLAARWITVRSDDDERETEWRIVAVVPDGPAARAGVREGDRLLSVNGRGLDGPRDGARLEAAAVAGQPLLLSLRRDDRAKLVAVPLPAVPTDADEDHAGAESPQ